MNPISSAFLLSRQYVVNTMLHNSITLDIASGLYPINKKAITLDIKSWKRPQITASCMHLPVRSGSIDSVTMLEVIEHIPGHLQKVALSEAKRVLKDNGQLIISTPHKTSFTRILWKIVWGIWENTIQKEYHHDHVGELDHTGFVSLLHTNGFKINAMKRVMLFDMILNCTKRPLFASTGG